MPVVLVGDRDDETWAIQEWKIAVLPNRKVLVTPNPEFVGLKDRMENTIKVRSARHEKHTGEEHMPVEKLFDAIISSWGTMGSTAVVVEDEVARKIIQEVGMK